jgi:hypothetical protein
MVVIVCGGRNFEDRHFVFKALDAFHHKHPITLLVHGGAQGADNMGRLWARERRIPIRAYMAEWDKYGGTAGPIRNRKMLEEQLPQAVIAFPGGSGTRHMVKIAKEANVKVWDLSKLYAKFRNVVVKVEND